MHNIDDSAKTGEVTFFIALHDISFYENFSEFFKIFRDFSKNSEILENFGKIPMLQTIFLKKKNVSFRIFEELSNEHTFGGLWAKIKNRHREKVFFQDLVLGQLVKKNCGTKCIFALQNAD